jgi:hypothetical protein
MSQELEARVAALEARLDQQIKDFNHNLEDFLEIVTKARDSVYEVEPRLQHQEEAAHARLQEEAKKLLSNWSNENVTSELFKIIETFAAEMKQFRSVHVSRRGVAGPAGSPGERGLPGGQGAQGNPGRDGKNADVSEVIVAAKQQMQSDLAAFQAGLASAIVSELKRSGVLDESGRAIPGPTGKDGKDGVVDVKTLIKALNG